LRLIEHRVPVHNRHVGKEEGESADINQNDFHESPFG
jgi:hypothetical protein